jgi:hypothetical protein
MAAPNFSRSGTTSPLGKCDDRLDIPMSSELKEAISALATIRGGGRKPASEYAREILEQHVFGVLPLMQRRLGPGGLDSDGRKHG